MRAVSSDHPLGRRRPGLQVGAALLDVFEKEPLPAESRLWRHPRVRITPHVASMTTLASAADQIADNIKAVLAGQPPLPVNLVDRASGY
jgi:glyoxylate/hydroxypyruvate reductase A